MNRSHLIAWVLTTSSLSALSARPIAAQVIPDATLPAGERSQVTGNPNVQIDGGARRGGNLFHSFSQFSIPTGGSAYFNNAADVQNIFSRMTGGSISNIDGVIRANGTANLFLLNPNGILFGPNARLNIGGSFIATTADSIHFADNFQYSATNPQTAPLLTVSAPIGLQMGANPGRIGVQGNEYDLSVSVPIFSPIVKGSSSAGLRVPTGQTLALIGGDINIEGGTLTAEQGRIELGSVRNGEVSLSDGFTFSYPGVKTFGNIRLSQQALADASDGGVIQVQGDQVSVVDGSLLLIQNQGTQAGGSINVNAAQSLELNGGSVGGKFTGGLNSQTLGVGSGADIAVSTRQLVAQDGAAIITRSYSPARAGNVTVQAADSIQVIGFSPANPGVISNIASTAFSSGDAGDVAVSTRELTALNGGGIAASTYGIGRGGNVTVNALDTMRLTGKSSLGVASGLTSIALSSGDAGQLTVNTSRLVIQNGGTVSTATLAGGRAGSITISASESVEVSGRSPVPATSPSGVGSSAPALPEVFRQTYGLPNRPGGNSGSVTINTPRLSISDGARVTVSNDGTGNAGTLRVNANSIVLDRGGTITAATAFGEGGNIDLNVRDVVLLRNNSPITASAGGTGGNIRINAGLIIALPIENSDIRANSINARGGNITINASGIFGIQFRPQDTPLSDITATGVSSAQSGTVQLNIERFDPTSGLVELPTTIADSSRLIAQGCPANQGNSFVITGRGGLPPTPEQQLDDDAVWSDRRRLTVDQQADRNGDREASSVSNSQLSIPNSSLFPRIPHPTPHTPVVEATGWQITPAGEILLVANTRDPTVQNRLSWSVVCSGGKSSTSPK